MIILFALFFKQNQKLKNELLMPNMCMIAYYLKLDIKTSYEYTANEYELYYTNMYLTSINFLFMHI